MRRPFARLSLTIATVAAVVLAGVVIARSWYANLLSAIGAKPIVTVLNDTGRDMTDVHLVLTGCDFLTKEYHFSLLEFGGEVSVTVDTGQEFCLKEMTFFVEGVEYQLVEDGPMIGPGEHRVMVVDNGMGVVWRWRPPWGVLRPIRCQAVPRAPDSEVAGQSPP